MKLYKSGTKTVQTEYSLTEEQLHSLEEAMLEEFGQEHNLEEDDETVARPREGIGYNWTYRISYIPSKD